ncbi:hypothetical protein [Holdemania massiliensis]|uniref:hypothetical protein n=1 Tax=Holdemania massiliensis TaxID=1468449 RepID=UPI001F0590AE|nr:hypothetical protein [Holdemania massiliensis]MCH1941123.1 hypothetical protein [Holdemania massiliensis]
MVIILLWELSVKALSVANRLVAADYTMLEICVKQLHINNYPDAFRILIENRAAEAELCLQFLLKYVIYSLVATEYVDMISTLPMM